MPALLVRPLVSVIVAASLIAVMARPEPPRGMTLLVPAYFYPGGSGLAFWDQLEQAAGVVQVQVVLNPSSGPGARSDPNYLAVLSRIRRAGCVVLGYVHTAWGERALAEVAAEIKAYQDLYGVDGYFLDEMSTDPRLVRYYERLYADIKRRNRRFVVVGNPGTNTDEAYVKAATADSLVLFEGPAASFVAYRPPGWVEDYPRSRFAAIIYDVPDEAAMYLTLRQSIRNHAGSVFVGDGQGSNPYDRLPVYWERTLRSLARRSATWESGQAMSVCTRSR
jgi:hypothetical protein